jgi:hypothetical protein
MLREAASWTSAQVVREGEFANLAVLSDAEDPTLSFASHRNGNSWQG